MSNIGATKLEDRIVRLERQNRLLFLLLFMIVAGCATVAAARTSADRDILDVVKTRNLQVFSDEDELVFDVKSLDEKKGVFVTMYAGGRRMSYWLCTQDGSDFGLYEKWPSSIRGVVGPSISMRTTPEQSRISVMGREHGNIRIGYTAIFDDFDKDALIWITGPDQKERIIKADDE